MTWEALRLIVEGEPVPKGRPRVTRYGTFTPERTRAAEEKIGWEMLQKHRGLQIDREDCFRVVLGFWTKRTTSDVDNLTKLVLDALQGVVWENDRQVTQVIARRHRLKGRMQPYTEIDIERAGRED